MTLKQLAEKVKAVYGKCYVSLQGEVVSPTYGESTTSYNIYISFQGVGSDTTKPTIGEHFTSLTDLESYVNSLSKTPTIDTDINPQVFESKNEDLLHEIQEREHEEMKENPEEFNYNLK